MPFYLVDVVCCVCFREKSSASAGGAENWKIGDLLLCLCSILPVRKVLCLTTTYFVQCHSCCDITINKLFVTVI